MGHKTGTLFRDDSYLKEAEASVVAINERGGIILDRTIFYAAPAGSHSGAVASEEHSRRRW